MHAHARTNAHVLQSKVQHHMSIQVAVHEKLASNETEQTHDHHFDTSFLPGFLGYDK